MRVIRRLLPWFLLLVTAVIILFFVLRRDTQAAYGTAVALCPGPDLYGYTCDSGAAFAYIDATIDTFLYQDDGVVTLELPFPFTFYGTTYTQLQASSNGNVQFGSRNADFDNRCLNDGPVVGMGDMIALFWDDLDLTRYGYLEYDVVGEAPNRIFVLEWDDIPRFGDSQDRVTFALQLFEGSQDILFLYEDVTLLEGSNGSSATIGIQSEAQGLALQFGCNQPVVANASRIRFVEPEEANAAVNGVATAVLQPATPLYVKGDAAELLNQLNIRGRVALADMHARWLSRSPQRTAVWQWLDLTGNGQEELILLRTGAASNPHLNDLMVFTQDVAGTFDLLFYQLLASREQLAASRGSRPELAAAGDLTHDGLLDVVVRDTTSGLSFVLTVDAGTVQQLPLPGSCTGSLAIMDVNEDGQAEVVQDGCVEGNGRVVTQWNGSAFVTLP